MSNTQGNEIDVQSTAKEAEIDVQMSDRVEKTSSVVNKILSFLPAKSLLRFKCVCRSWVSIIEDEQFVADHLNRGGSAVYMAPKIDGIVKESWKILTTGLGLVLEESNLSKALRIRNPTTRLAFGLHDPPRLTNSKIRIVYAHSTGRYSVICFDEKKDGTSCCYVLTLGRNEPSWRVLSMPSSNCPGVYGHSVQVLGEVVYYIRGGNKKSYFIEIISLDMGSECFSSNFLPRNHFSGMTEIRRVIWNGCLAFGGFLKDMLHVYVLEDYNNHRWSERQNLGPLPILSELSVVLLFEPLLIQVNGRVLYFSFKYHPINILFRVDDLTCIRRTNLLEVYESGLIRKTLASFKGMESEIVLKSVDPKEVSMAVKALLKQK